MLGSKSRVFGVHPAVCLDQLVSPDDFYRFLDARLDLSFVRDWVSDDYADRGRPSIDPVVFFKLQLILFFEGLRSERQLMRVVADRLSLRWYLGYDLGEPLPDHSSLTRIRGRYGQEIFQRFFERVVELCQKAGLVWGRELIIDATKVRANADLDSLAPRYYVRATAEAAQHVAALFADGQAALPPAAEAADPGAAVPAQPTPGESKPPLPRTAATEDGVGVDVDAPAIGATPVALPVDLDAARRATLAAENEAHTSWLELRQHDPTRPASGSYQRISDLRVSTTDPDATPVAFGDHTALGYQDHYVVDGGKARIILAARVLPGDVRENIPLPDLVQRVCFRWHLQPERAIADAAYGTGENVRCLEEAGIHAYMPLVEREPKGPFYQRASFTYDADRDVYTCPQGTELAARGNSYTTRVRIYQAPTATCQACPVRGKCTDSSQGRRLDRHFAEPYRERVRAYQGTPAYAKAMRKRAVWVEPLFGEAKDWHGLRRFRLRGLENVNIEGLRIAAGQNLKRYLAATGWGRRQAPGGSLVARAATILPGQLTW